MDERRMWSAEQLEAIETFRSKDEATSDAALLSMAEALAQDAELSHRLDCVLKWDARLSEAIRDVPVPTGLAEQIIRNLEESGQCPTATPTAASVNRPRRRGTWITAAAGIGAAAVLIAVAILGRLPHMSPDRLRDIALDQFTTNQGNGPTGTLVSAQNVPARFPYSSDLFVLPGTRWRSITGFDRARGVAYDIPLRPGQKATLYVVRCRSSTPIPTRVPLVPQMWTRGLAVSAWQGNGVVYVVVVEGEEPAYRALLKSRPYGLT